MKQRIFIHLIVILIESVKIISGIKCYSCSKCPKESVGKLIECSESAKACLTMFDGLSKTYTRGCSSKGQCPSITPNLEDRCDLCWTDGCNDIETKVTKCLSCKDEFPNADCSANKIKKVINCPPWNTCYYKAYKVENYVVTERGCESPLICMMENWLILASTVRELDGGSKCSICSENLCNSRPFNRARYSRATPLVIIIVGAMVRVIAS